MLGAPAGQRPRTYALYGLRFRSCLELPYPEFPAEGPHDVEIFEAPACWFEAIAGEVRLPDPSWYYHAPCADQSVYLRWRDLFEFLVSADGRRIACRILAGGSVEAFHTYLLGQVLSFALVKQGLEPLHATTVVVQGSAVGFLGSSGDGKSSLAASFLAAGFALLTDDLLIARFTGSHYCAYPGQPRIKLFPEVAEAVLGGCPGGPPMNSLTPKRILPLGAGQYCPTPVPLRSLYLLHHPRPGAPGEPVVVRRLSERRACLALLRHSFNTKLRHRDRMQHRFSSATELASRIPVKLLSYPRDLARLPDVRAAILANLAR